MTRELNQSMLFELTCNTTRLFHYFVILCSRSINPIWKYFCISSTLLLVRLSVIYLVWSAVHPFTCHLFSLSLFSFSPLLQFRSYSLHVALKSSSSRSPSPIFFRLGPYHFDQVPYLNMQNMARGCVSAVGRWQTYMFAAEHMNSHLLLPAVREGFLVLAPGHRGNKAPSSDDDLAILESQAEFFPWEWVDGSID